MRIPITLEEFLFTLNQDEDIRITLIDYERCKWLYFGWKTDFYTLEHKYDDWFVQNFTSSENDFEITIVKNKEDLN